jgi:hypothetical protein
VSELSLSSNSISSSYHQGHYRPHISLNTSQLSSVSQSLPLHKGVTPRMSQRKTSNVVCEWPSSGFNNYHFCKDKFHCFCGVVCYSVLHLCFWVRPFYNMCTKKPLFFSNFCNSSSFPLHSLSISWLEVDQNVFHYHCPITTFLLKLHHI